MTLATLERLLARVAAAVSALALGAGCGDAARALSSGPGGTPSALAFVDALRCRFGAVEREPGLEALRPKLSASLMAPSKIFDDASVWTVSEGDWRALWLEGRGRPGAYRLGLRATSPPPQAPGEYRARIALSRHEPGRFEWTTSDELALGRLRPQDVATAFRALLRAAEAEAGRDARPLVVQSMPRSARAFGSLFDLERLFLVPAPGRTLRIEVALRLQPERLKLTAPKLASYTARYSRGLRLGITARVPDGRPLWVAQIEDTAWRLQLRVLDGELVPLDGEARHEAGRIRASVDYSFKSGPFRVGVRALPVELDPSPRRGELAFSARFVEQPDWQLPFLIEPFMRGSLRYPFEPPGSEYSLSVRPEPHGGSALVSGSRVRIRESWIVRWLGGFTSKALNDLRAAEAEADRFALEGLSAVRDDLHALAAGPASAQSPSITLPSPPRWSSTEPSPLRPRPMPGIALAMRSAIRLSGSD